MSYVRAIVAKRVAEARSAERGAHAVETASLKRKIEELERQVERSTAATGVIDGLVAGKTNREVTVMKSLPKKRKTGRGASCFICDDVVLMMLYYKNYVVYT